MRLKKPFIPLVTGALLLSIFSPLPQARSAAPDTVVIALQSAPQSLNPNGINSWDQGSQGLATFSNMGFDYLDQGVVTNNTNFGSYVVTSESPFKVTYTVNSGRFWSDGTPITAVDLLFSHLISSNQYSKDAGLGDPNDQNNELSFQSSLYGGLYSENVDGNPVLSQDKMSMTVTFKKKFPDWKTLSPKPFPVHALVHLANQKETLQSVSDNLVAKSAFESAFFAPKSSELLQWMGYFWSKSYGLPTGCSQFNITPLHTVGNGPYILTGKDDVAGTFTMEYNPRYNSGPETNGIKKIIFKVLADQNAITSAVSKKEVDLVNLLPTADSAAFGKSATGYTLLSGPGAIYEHIDLRVGPAYGKGTYSGPFAGNSEKAIDLRTAFLLAFPRDEIVEKLIKPIDATAATLNSQFRFQTESGYSDIAAASGVSKYTAGDQASRTASALALVKKHFPDASATNAVVNVKLLWGTTTNTRRSAMAALIKPALAKAGFNVDAPGVGNWSSELSNNNYDATMFAWALNGGGAQVGRAQTFVSTNNSWGYSDATYDSAVVDLANTEYTSSQITDKYKILEKKVIDAAVSLPLFQHPQLVLANSALQNYKLGTFQTQNKFWEWSYAGSSKVNLYNGGAVDENSVPKTNFASNLADCNVKLKIVDPSDATKSLMGMALIRQSGAQNVLQGIEMPSGTGSAKVADGNYSLELKAEGFSPKLFTLSVSGATVTIKAGSQDVPISEGRFLLAPDKNNLSLKLVDPLDGTKTLTGWGNLQVCTPGKNYCEWVEGNDLNFPPSGVSGKNLNDGEYELILEANGETYAQTRFRVTVSGGGKTVAVTKGGAPVTKQGDVFIISPAIANVLGTIVDEKDAVVLPSNNKWVDVQIEKWKNDGNYWDWTGINSGIDNSGKFRVAVSGDGKYRIKVSPNGYADLAASMATEFTVTDGKFFLGASTTGVDKLDSLVIKLSSANFKVKLVSPTDPNQLLNGWIGVQRKMDNGTTWVQNIDINNGVGGANLSDGEYLLEVNVHQGSYARSYLTLTIEGSNITLQSASKVYTKGEDGRYVISPAEPNVAGSVVKAGDLAITIGNGQWISLNLQKWNTQNNFWEWTPNWTGTDNTGKFNFAISEPGKYRIMAMPNGISGVSNGASAEFEYLQNGKFKVTGGAEVDSLTGATNSIKITLLAPNFNIKLVDSKTKAALTQGWINVMLEDPVTKNLTWIQNMDINPSNGGQAGASLTPGTYRLDVNTNLSGYARSIYYVEVNPNLTIKKLSKDGAEVAAGAGGVYEISPGLPNVTAKIVDGNGVVLVPGNNRWISVNVQKYNAQGNYWEWTNNWSNPNNEGTVAISISEAGTYRLRIEPNGYAGVTTTYSDQFVITNPATDTKAFGDIKLGSPSIMVKVVQEGSTTGVSFVGIEIKRNGNWLDWVNTGPTGIASISLTEEGSYEFVVHPSPTLIEQGAAKKSFKVTATKSGEKIIGTVDGVAKGSDGTFTVALGAGNVKGVVKTPANANIANSQVVAREVSTNRDLWEYSSQSSANGSWSMNLPEGEYKIIAMAPWGTSDYGNSDLSGIVKVDKNGAATATGFQPSNMTLNLKAPRWKGTIYAPNGTTPIPFANINLRLGDEWMWANADANGNFAISVSNFTAFSENDYMELRDDRNGTYPMRRWEGKGAGAGTVETALGGSTKQDVKLSFLGANFTVKVFTDETKTTAASSVWVGVDADGVGWLGGNRTNAEGIASFNIDATKLTTGNLRIRVDVNGNQELSAKYTATTTTFDVAPIKTALTSGSTQKEVSLATPNLRGELREPGQGATSPWSWIELFDDSTGEWLGGTNTDANGLFSLFIKTDAKKDFTVRVNPSWNSTSGSSLNQYTVSVDPAATEKISLTLKGSTTKLNKVTGQNYYAFSLASPSVTGTVVKADSTGVRDSWVVPVNDTTGEYMWQYGSNTRDSGKFSMALPDGTYRIEANVPWNATNLSKSAQCLVTVAGSKVTASECPGATSGSIKLTLRSPNLTFTLAKKVDGVDVAVPFANVGIGVGNWYTNAQSNQSGKVSLFIDKDAIIKSNGYGADVTQKISVWVDPPWGTSDIVRFDCLSGDAEPLCKDLVDFNSTTGFTEKNLVDAVLFAAPNLKVKITNPAGDAGLQFAWVNLFTKNGQWLGAASADKDGFASFNVSDDLKTGNFRLEIYPPWNASTTYSRVVYGESSDLSFADLNWDSSKNNSFKIGSPNLVVYVKTSAGKDNKWGWIGLEEVETTSTAGVYNTKSWINGTGLDNTGKAAITIDGSKLYRLSLNPGPGAIGARTECIFETDANKVVKTPLTSCLQGSLDLSQTPDLITVSLDSGNVKGKVTYNGKPVEGALIYANLKNATDESKAVTGVSAVDGTFGLMLNQGEWVIKIFPVEVAGQDSLKDKVLAAITVGGTTVNIAEELTTLEKK